MLPVSDSLLPVKEKDRQPVRLTTPPKIWETEKPFLFFSVKRKLGLPVQLRKRKHR
jgi:hypothetical protein